MESLAKVVAIIFFLIIFSGPIGLLLTLSPIWNATLKVPFLWYLRRLFISLLALVGIVMGFLVLSSGIPLGALILVITGMIINLIALKIEYQIGKSHHRNTPRNPGVF